MVKNDYNCWIVATYSFWNITLVAFRLDTYWRNDILYTINSSNSTSPL